MFEPDRSYCLVSLNTSYVEEYLKKTVDFSDIQNVYVIKPVDNIGIDEIRNAIDFLSISKEKTKYLVIYDAEKMTTEAVNAFLKTLEEPNKNSVIILTTTNWKNLLKTVRSRVERRFLVPEYVKELGNFDSFENYLTLKDYSFFLKYSAGNLEMSNEEEFFEKIDEMDKFDISLNFYELLGNKIKLSYPEYLEFVRRFKDVNMNLDILKSIVLSAMWVGYKLVEKRPEKVPNIRDFLKMCDDILKSKISNYNYFMTISAVLVNLRKLIVEEGNK